MCHILSPERSGRFLPGLYVLSGERGRHIAYICVTSTRRLAQQKMKLKTQNSTLLNVVYLAVFPLIANLPSLVAFYVRFNSFVYSICTYVCIHSVSDFFVVVLGWVLFFGVSVSHFDWDSEEWNKTRRKRAQRFVELRFCCPASGCHGVMMQYIHSRSYKLYSTVSIYAMRNNTHIIYNLCIECFRA